MTPVAVLLSDLWDTRLLQPRDFETDKPAEAQTISIRHQG